MKYYTISELCTITKGTTGIMKAVPGPYPLVTTSFERKTSNSYDFDDDAVCIPLVSSTGHGHKSLNYIHYQSGKFALGTILAAIIPKDKTCLSAEYLQRYLFFFKDQLVVPLMRGAANVSLAIKDIAKIQVPVPSISKQKKYIKLFNKAENGKLALLHQTQTQSTYLTKLRQAILQEAIEGKLTSNWRKENPVRKGDPDYDAEALLEKIQSEKEKLIKEGKIKKQKPLAPIKVEEIPFELPEGWVWTRLGEIITISSGDGLVAKDMANTGKIPVFGGNGINGYHDTFNVNKPTIVIGRVGAHCGAIHLTPSQAWITDNAFKTAYNEKYLDRTWLINLLKSLNLRMRARETAQPVISGQRVYPVLTPLPPLAEQRAIVKQVEKLLSMVDELEKQVSERKEQSKQLMQAVLKEAFEGRR